MRHRIAWALLVVCSVPIIGLTASVLAGPTGIAKPILMLVIVYVFGVVAGTVWLRRQLRS